MVAWTRERAVEVWWEILILNVSWFADGLRVQCERKKVKDDAQFFDSK